MLVTWRPSGHGGELLLRPARKGPAAVFLAGGVRDARVTGFSLRPEKEALLMTLQLEAEDVG